MTREQYKELSEHTERLCDSHTESEYLRRLRLHTELALEATSSRERNRHLSRIAYVHALHEGERI